MATSSRPGRCSLQRSRIQPGPSTCATMTKYANRPANCRPLPLSIHVALCMMPDRRRSRACSRSQVRQAPLPGRPRR